MRISYKNLKRYKEIAHVLIKYGFSVIVEKLNIEEVAYKIPITNPSEEIKEESGESNKEGNTVEKVTEVMSVETQENAKQEDESQENQQY